VFETFRYGDPFSFSAQRSPGEEAEEALPGITATVPLHCSTAVSKTKVAANIGFSLSPSSCGRILLLRLQCFH
jgi:hypothetical protein